MPAGLGSELVFETTPFFSFHHINAFEADNGKVVVDTCAMEGIDFGNNFEVSMCLAMLQISQSSCSMGVLACLVGMLCSCRLPKVACVHALSV